MSETIEVDTGTGTAADASASDQHARPSTKTADPAAAIQLETGALAPGDAEALRASQDALAQAQQRLNQESAQRRRAENQAASLRNQAAREAQGRVVERQAALTESAAAADADVSRAKIALRAAFEAGDADGIASAQEQIASATYRKNQAQTNLAALGQPGMQQAPAPMQDGGPADNWVPGARARQWLDEHPQMETDPDYKDLAITLHNQALRRGYAAESDEYFNVINSGLAKMYSDGGAGRGTAPMNHNGGTTQGSSAAPSNRGGGGASSGAFKTARTGIGDLQYARRQDGGLRIMSPTGETLDNMREAAALNYPTEYSKDPNVAMKLVMAEYVRIHEERESGGTGGLIYGDGSTFR